MKYTFYVYFLKNKSRWAFFAILIRLAIHRPYNHVEVVAVPNIPTMPARFYGAVSPVSRMASSKKIEEHYELIKIMPLENFNGFSDIENIKYLDALCGKPYSKLQIVLQLIGAVSYWAKRALSRTKLNYDHLLICTELAADFMGERMGYVLDTTYDACEFEDLINAKPKGA